MKDTTTVVDFSLCCMAFWWNIWLIKQDRCIHVAVMISSILDDFTDCKVERRARTGAQNVFLDCCRVWTCAAMCQWISSPSPQPLGQTAISPCPNHHIYIHTIAPYVLVSITHIMKYVGQGLSPRKHPSYEHVFFDESSVHFSYSLDRISVLKSTRTRFKLSSYFTHHGVS